MQIEHLVYCGKREEGTLTVGRVDILSPFRKIKFYKGLRLEIGKQIPLDVATIIAKDYPTVFTWEKKNLNDSEGYELQLSDVVEECLARMGDEAALKVVSNVVSKYFGGHELKKKGDKKPEQEKKKITRRRK